MLKKVFVTLLFGVLVGCDVPAPPTSSAPPTLLAASAPTLKFKWAVVDNHKLLTKTKLALASKLGYEANEKDSELDSLQKQREVVVKAFSQECLDQYYKNYPEEKPKTEQEAVKKSLAINGRLITLPQTQSASSPIRNSVEFYQCTVRVNKDPRLLEINNKTQAIHDLRNKLEATAKEKIIAAIPAYAEKEGYELIISNNSSNVQYSKDKVVVDVTDAIVDLIVKDQN